MQVPKLICQGSSLNPMYIHEGVTLRPQKWARTIAAVSEGSLEVRCTDFDCLHNDVIKYCSDGRVHEALTLIYRAVKQGIWHSCKLYSCILKACIAANALVEG
eukprot:c39223_g1_i1 orf=1-306(-)